MHAEPRPIPRQADRSPLPWVIGALLLAAVGGAGVWWALRGGTEPPPAPAAAPAAEPVAPAPAAPPPIRHPIEQAPVAQPAEPAAPLPALGESDALLFEALAGVLADDGWRALLAGDFLIQRFVATVDNLPRRKLAPHLLPVKAAAGTLAVVGTPESATLAPANYARYDAWLRVLEAVDAQRLVALYVRLYPLFQQAYRELGSADGYFNDRLVEVIDHLVAAPDATPPVQLVRPKVFWEFADPALEQASAGEKLMVRIGPAHAAKVRAKLAAVRALLVAASPAPG
jgi:hypothetical protein